MGRDVVLHTQERARERVYIKGHGDTMGLTSHGIIGLQDNNAREGCAGREGQAYTYKVLLGTVLCVEQCVVEYILRAFLF